MSIVLRFVICSLAVFRLSEMFVIDDGLFDVFANIRGWFNKAAFDNSLRRTIANGLQCVHCTGVWFAFLVSFTFFYSSPVIDFILLLFAIAGLQSLLANNLGRNK